MTALEDTNPEALTDEEWRDFQSIPDQGYSHRHWVNWKIAGRVAALRGELADAQRRIEYLLTVPSNTHRDALTARAEVAEAKLAQAWEEGARWAAVECGAIENEGMPWLAPGDNPYREQRLMTALDGPEIRTIRMGDLYEEFRRGSLGYHMLEALDTERARAEVAEAKLAALEAQQRPQIRAVIEANIGNAINPHSWRCENPDRFPGYCRCVDEITDEVVAALTEPVPDTRSNT